MRFGLNLKIGAKLKESQLKDLLKLNGSSTPRLKREGNRNEILLVSRLVEVGTIPTTILQNLDESSDWGIKGLGNLSRRLAETEMFEMRKRTKGENMTHPPKPSEEQMSAAEKICVKVYDDEFPFNLARKEIFEALLAEFQRGRNQGVEEAAKIIEKLDASELHFIAPSFWADKIRILKGE